jgi:ATP-binding protein involved in chromosome partitioning
MILTKKILKWVCSLYKVPPVQVKTLNEYRIVIHTIATDFGVILDESRIRITDKTVKLIINTKDFTDDNALVDALKKTIPEFNFFIIHETEREKTLIVHNSHTPKPQKKIPHSINGSIRPASIKKILVVASGKGGVGKSIVSLNLARCLQAKGLKVALIDCDIYGPSCPVMTGGYEKAVYKDKKLQPIIRDGLKIMSIGYMIDPSKAVIWRGPMVSGAIGQMFQETEWGDIDIAIVDMPPGTGDAQITICQNVSPDGAIIVSQPQIVSIIDAERCASMFDSMALPIWGVIENMSGFVAPDTGKTYYIFGQGGAEAFAKAKNYPFLGALPIIPMMAYCSDQGMNALTVDTCDAFINPLMDIAQYIMTENLESV